MSDFSVSESSDDAKRIEAAPKKRRNHFKEKVTRVPAGEVEEHLTKLGFHDRGSEKFICCLCS